MSTIQVLSDHPRVETSVKRIEDGRLLRGAGKFVDDLHPENLGYMGIVRSTYPRALIKKIDFSKAREAPEFIDALTGEDLTSPIPIGNPRQKQAKRYHLAKGETRFVGEAVAAIVVNNKYAVEDVLELVEVEYEPLKPILTIEDSERNEARVYDDWNDNIVFQQTMKKGDVATAFADSKHSIKTRIGIRRQAAAAIEPRSVVAHFDKVAGTYTISVTTQSPYRMRDGLAGELQVPPEKVHIVVEDMGGGFGSKGAPSYPEPVLACLLSKKTGLSIKWTSTRTEDLLETAGGRDIYCDIELACDENGKLTAIRARNQSDAGVTGSMSIQLNNSMNLIPGVYKVPNFELTGETYTTNKSPVGPLRGAGRPEGCFFIERAINILAKKITMDPAELRMRNLIQPDEFPYESGTGSVYDSGNFPLLLKKLLENSDYADLKNWRDKINKDRSSGLVAGIGLCVQVEDTGAMGKESAKVAITKDCRVKVWTGSSPHGQSIETTYAQLAAAEFGVSLERTKVFYGDSSSLPWGIGTFGSRSLSIGGSAVVDACRKVKVALVTKASEIYGVSQTELEIQGGQLVRTSFDEMGKSIAREVIASLSALAERAGPVEAMSDFSAKGVPFASAAQLCALTIDRRTGLVRLEKYVAVDDCGVPVNPMVVYGQMHGGIIHGIGGALYELSSHNEEGQLTTTNFMDYTMPTALDVPREISLDHIETPSPLTLHGGKGVGETGTIGAYPAIFNALNDALAEAGSGKELNVAPVFPEEVLRAIQN